MGFLGVIFALIGAAISYWNGNSVLMWLCVLAASAVFLVDQRCQKQALATARQRPDFDGTFVEADLKSVSGPLTVLTFFLIALCLVLAGVAIAQAL